MQWAHRTCTTSRYPSVGSVPSRYPPRMPHLCGTGFIQDLIYAAIDVLFSPFEAIFEPLVEPLVDLIALPDIGFSISVSFEGSPQGNDC